jgi:hypothetical protein
VFHAPTATTNPLLPAQGARTEGPRENVVVFEENVLREER